MTHDDTHDDLSAMLCDIARPVLIWAAHFIIAYAALSAACAERGLIDFRVAQVVVLIATVLAVVGAGWGTFRPGGADLRRAARWAGIISVLAILFSAAPLALMQSCG